MWAKQSTPPFALSWDCGSWEVLYCSHVDAAVNNQGVEANGCHSLLSMLARGGLERQKSDTTPEMNTIGPVTPVACFRRGNNPASRQTARVSAAIGRGCSRRWTSMARGHSRELEAAISLSPWSSEYIVHMYVRVDLFLWIAAPKGCCVVVVVVGQKTDISPNSTATRHLTSLRRGTHGVFQIQTIDRARKRTRSPK